MQAERFDGPAAFLDAVGSHLASAEAVNNLMLGVAKRLADGRKMGGGEPLCAAVRDDSGVIAGAALWTPPLRIMLSLMPPAAAACLAEALWGWGVRPHGAMGPAETVRAFCERLTGEPRVVRGLRVFELRAVTTPAAAPGAMRAATAADHDLVADWYAEFSAEASSDSGGNPRETARVALEEGRVFLWIDERPVSIAAITRRLTNGAAVGAVYTPKESRRHGYATCLVAALSQKILDDGAKFACLFTDATNATSNAIYAKVGYSQVCDVLEVDLAGPA